MLLVLSLDDVFQDFLLLLVSELFFRREGGGGASFGAPKSVDSAPRLCRTYAIHRFEVAPHRQSKTLLGLLNRCKRQRHHFVAIVDC